MAGVFAHWPNRITALRFVGALVLFFVLALWGTGRTETEPGAMTMLCFFLFVIIALTDYLDGYLARRDNLVSAFGRIADPFVDKVLVLGTMIFLAVMPWSQEWFPAWIVVVVLAREFLVTGIRGYVESQGESFAADGFGKIKMVVQCFAIGFCFGRVAFPWESIGIELEWLSWGTHILVWATLLTSVGSGATYVLKARAHFAQ
ncbi:MAG: CDP-diacylglycerol--glycerol-3-phosphate 3-phosphatidyltransferase [Planctomycetota bacterium]|nr:CDP-diacylglycerol--glycerol-3-phosphate 3-phosphatidyltransferase [Planctomycetota bacterium]